MIKELALADIRTDGDTQQRPVSDEQIKEFKAAMERGDDFPPVQVVFDGKNHWLVDGFHRLYATDKLGKKYIKASIETGTQRDAQLFSFRANYNNGEGRTKETIHNIVKKMSEDDEWGKMSQKDMAKWIGISEQLLSYHLKQLRKEKKDAADRKAKAEGTSKKSNTTKETTKATTKAEPATADSEPKPKPPVVYKDSTGKIVPENLVDIFSRVKVFSNMSQQLTDMQKTIEDYKKNNDPLFYFLDVLDLKPAIANVKSVLSMAKPYSVCLYCEGEGKGCRACDNRGFGNKLRYISTAAELKEKKE